MNISIKQVVRAAIAASVVAAGAAHASIALPSSGNGSLVLFVTNTSTQQVYARDLGIHIDDIITQGTGAGQTGDSSLLPFNTLNYSLGSITADPTLNGFLTGDLSNFTWGVMAGDSVGGNTFAAPRRTVATQGGNSWVASTPSNIVLQNENSAANSFMTLVQSALGSASSVVASIGSGSGSIPESQLENFFGFGSSVLGGVGTGSPQDFFLFTSAGNGSGGSGANGTPARIFQLAGLTLSDTGTLASAVTSEVPLPAAAWLFGSGLMGLAGIGRRRKIKATA